MSQPSPELILEVNIFEALEQVGQLTLGQLTQLRIQSRSQQVNLLYLAYQNQVISAQIAQRVAQELGMVSHQAPWSDDESIQGRSSENMYFHRDQPFISSNSSISLSSHSTTSQSSISQSSISQSSISQSSSSMEGSSLSNSSYNRRKFAQRASLTESINYAQQAQEPSQNVSASKKRSFADLNLKTEIEINLPSLMEERIVASEPYSQAARLVDQSEINEKHEQGFTQDLDLQKRWVYHEKLEHQTKYNTSLYKQKVTDILLKRELWLTSEQPINIEHDIGDLDDCVDSSLVQKYQLLESYGLDNQSLLLTVKQSMEDRSILCSRLVPNGEVLSQKWHHSWPIKQKEQTVQTILSSLCRQLYQAHSNGVVHRAIDMSALYINDSQVYLSSWEWAADELWLQKEGEGLLSSEISPWLAPEVIDKQVIGLKDWILADIYSVGVLLFWLLTASYPPPSKFAQQEQLQQSLGNLETNLHSLCLAFLSSAHERPQSLLNYIN